MNNPHANLHWIIGGATALGGAAFVRFGPHILGGELPPLIKAGGMLVALIGLFIITLGVRRRADSEPEYRPSASEPGHHTPR
jgi:hypothetical protein